MEPKAGLVQRVMQIGVAVAILVGAGAGSTRADVTSDQAAAILVFPKILVDSSTPPQTNRGPIDTLIRVSNTADRPVSMSCFYVNANGHCSNAPTTICDPYDRSASNPCGSTGICEAGWQESDFMVHMTPRQPIAWLASAGAVPCAESDPNLPCFPLSVDGHLNRIQPVPEDPFVGELKCIEVDANGVPIARNDLKGEAELVRSDQPAGVLDVAAYNAIGIPAIPGNNDKDNVLVLGGGVCIGGSRAGSPCSAELPCPGGRCSAEYSGCPNILVLDHFFDGAIDPISGFFVTTKLTLVPCSEDFEQQKTVSIPVQFLVFNEFEQRFSTSNSVNCYQEFKLTDIDRADPQRSIFSAAVNGTLTGQTRLRGVVLGDERYGYTLLGVAEEHRDKTIASPQAPPVHLRGGTGAFNLHLQGTRPQSDFVYLP